MEKLKTNTHAHTQRAIYAKTHIQCQQMKIILEDVIQLFYLFIYLFILLMFYFFRSASNFPVRVWERWSLMKKK